MNTELKYVGVGLMVIALIAAMVFGAFLPFLKSQRYIQAINSLGSVRSVGEFKANYDNVFGFYSPVGHEEVAKFFGTDMIGFVRQNGSEAVAHELADYADGMMVKTNVRHLLILGQVYFALWDQYGKRADYERARDYYREALSIGPILPPVLYGLLDIYRIGGDIEGAKDTARKILAIWPEDADVARFLGDLERVR
jgi:tetratricopeptide (TPR) repeat protein